MTPDPDVPIQITDDEVLKAEFTRVANLYKQTLAENPRGKVAILTALGKEMDTLLLVSRYVD